MEPCWRCFTCLACERQRLLPSTGRRRPSEDGCVSAKIVPKSCCSQQIVTSHTERWSSHRRQSLRHGRYRMLAAHACIVRRAIVPRAATGWRRRPTASMAVASPHHQGCRRTTFPTPCMSRESSLAKAERFSGHSGRSVSMSQRARLVSRTAPCALARHASLAMVRRYAAQADMLKCAPHRSPGVGVYARPSALQALVAISERRSGRSTRMWHLAGNLAELFAYRLATRGRAARQARTGHYEKALGPDTRAPTD